MCEKNQTFCGAEPTWANACVGNNGNPDYWTYAKGYSQAAKLLIKAVIDDKGKHCFVDEFIYPVCFNMRHSVELRLKGAIQQLQQIAVIRGTSLQFDLNASHDIGKIWDLFSTQSTTMDNRYLPINNKIEPIILDIAQVDPTGQTFRYAINRESQKHLINIYIINFINLHNKFSLLEDGLDSLQYFGEFLIDEYHCHTFTRNLSRHQIWEIAKKLPPKNRWTDDSFDDIRNSLKKKYSISGKELSTAINLIKNHYEFAPLIDEHLALLGLKDEHIFIFIEMVIKIANISKTSNGISLGQLDISHLKSVAEYGKLLEESWRVFEPLINPQILAGLRALFYFARELKFSEEYYEIYDDEVANCQTQFKQRFFDILSKGSALFNLIRSLYFLRQTDLAEEVVQRFGLESEFEWLGDARSLKLFKKPDHFGYK